MKRIKSIKITGVVIALVMSVSVLTACAGSESAEKNVTEVAIVDDAEAATDVEQGRDAEPAEEPGTEMNADTGNMNAVVGDDQAQDDQAGEDVQKDLAESSEPETLPEKKPELLNIPVWVTTGNVNMRAEPSTESEVLKKLGRYAQLTLCYEEDGWGAVEDESVSGFVSLEYLTREEPAANAYVVVIDPGHQRKGDSAQEPDGPDSSTMKARVTGGTSGRTTGVAEYELTLDISLQLRDELKARGYTVYMTRETHDVNISNMERAQYATSVGADIAVRIHANGVDDSSVSGALALTPSSSNAYVSALASDSRMLSQCVLDAYCDATGMKNQGVINSDTMTGINWSTVPVTILEMGYMTNPSDDVNMEDEAYQKKMVLGIADGIDSYFGL